MDKNFYREWAELEDNHWWFIARRRILEQAIKNINFNADPEILEVGCGTGGNLSLITKYGKLFALESSDDAIQLANTRRITNVEKGDLPDNIPFGNKNFDLIVMLDVLEHIDNDLFTLKILRERLKPEGRIILTVPAYQFLWSHQDEISHHKRRYTLKRLKRIVTEAGFAIEYSTYFNSILFPVVVLIRLFKNTVRSIAGSKTNLYEGSDFNMPSAMTNRLLTGIFSIERFAVPIFTLPFGVSIMVVARAN